jgi:syntaxin-binding protein 5
LLIFALVTDSEARIFRPSTGKGSHRSFDDYLCDTAAVAHFENHGYALVGIFGYGITKAFSIPGLKEICKADLYGLDRSRISYAIVAGSGDIFAFTGPSEIAMLNVWGTGKALKQSKDILYNTEASIPPRPTISNLQWISGTQYISPTDLDLLIGGPDRLPSKRMLAAAAAESTLQSSAGSSSRAVPGTTPNQEGWGDYMTRQLQERTEHLNIVGESMERMQENSAGWAEDASKWAAKQKRNLILGSITGKFL